MIKSLAAFLGDLDSQIVDYIRRFIHMNIQAFVKGSLREMIQHVAKKKRPVVAYVLCHMKLIQRALQHIFDIMVDRADGDPVDKTSPVVITARDAAISLSQVRLCVDINASFSTFAPCWTLPSVKRRKACKADF
jgi:hypothetical protein